MTLPMSLLTLFREREAEAARVAKKAAETKLKKKIGKGATSAELALDSTLFPTPPECPVATRFIVNDSTDYRVDLMPFGGIKKSGLGREGIKYALMEMTEPKMVCFNL